MPAFGSSAVEPPHGKGETRLAARDGTAAPSWSIVRVAVAAAMAATFLIWLHSESHKDAALQAADAPIVAPSQAHKGPMPPYRPSRKEASGG